MSNYFIDLHILSNLRKLLFICTNRGIIVRILIRELQNILNILLMRLGYLQFPKKLNYLWDMCRQLHPNSLIG